MFEKYHTHAILITRIKAQIKESICTTQMFWLCGLIVYTYMNNYFNFVSMYASIIASTYSQTMYLYAFVLPPIPPGVHLSIKPMKSTHQLSSILFGSAQQRTRKLPQFNSAPNGVHLTESSPHLANVFVLLNICEYVYIFLYLFIIFLFFFLIMIITVCQCGAVAQIISSWSNVNVSKWRWKIQCRIS